MVEYIAFSGHAVGADANPPVDIFTIASSGLGESSLGQPDSRPVGWMPDGRYLLVLRGAALWAVPVMNGIMDGTPLMIQRNLGTAFHGVPSITPLGITSSGVFYYRNVTSTSDIYIASMDPTSGKVISMPTPLPITRSGFNVLPRWSPDGAGHSLSLGSVGTLREFHIFIDDGTRTTRGSERSGCRHVLVRQGAVRS